MNKINYNITETDKINLINFIYFLSKYTDEEEKVKIQFRKLKENGNGGSYKTINLTKSAVDYITDSVSEIVHNEEQ